MFFPKEDKFLQLAKEYNLVPVALEFTSDKETPITIFEKLQAKHPVFMLESGDGSEKTARYSFIGLDPFMTFKSRENRIELIENGETTIYLDNPLTLLERILSSYNSPKLPSLPHFSGGAVGYLGYEMAGFIENIKRAEPKGDTFYDSYLMFCKTILVFDHRYHKLTLIENVIVENGREADQYEELTAKLSQLRNFIDKPLPHSNQPNKHKYFSNTSSNLSQTEFEDKVELIKEYIKSGDIFQTVLSRRLTLTTNEDPFELYRILRSVNPSPYMYYLNFPDIQLIGASPEMLVKLVDDEVIMRPIAGTRKRGETKEQDNNLEKDLLEDHKERAEHLMLLDLGRNDVGKVSEFGTVKESNMFSIEKFSHVMHIVSEVRGKKSKNLSQIDALSACFPAGTISGAPKIRAMEIISQVEPEERGPYSGAVGYFSFNGNMDTAITIRTMVKQGDSLHLQAGAGIVYDSVPDAEFQETENKLKGLMRVLEIAKEQGGVCDDTSSR